MFGLVEVFGRPLQHYDINTLQHKRPYKKVDNEIHRMRVSSVIR